MDDKQSDSSQGAAPEGRLELTWTNKQLRLLAHEDGSYEWVHPADYRVAEVRLLHDIGTAGEVAKRRTNDNLLIRGDALNALTSLARLPEFAREFLGKVKLIYIDPPFNTQQSFLQYDDALEHSVWLTMMRDRLLQIRDLLSADGSVWVHLDQTEVHYCKIVLDEVFGRSNFVGEVIWRAADSSNNDAKQFSVDHNTILVYSREPGWRSIALERGEEDNAHYSNPDNDPRGPWFPGNVSSPNPRTNLRYVIDEAFGWGGTPIDSPANGWRWQPDTIREKIDSGEVVLREDTLGKPRLLRKTYLADQTGLAPSSLWGDIEDTGHNRQAKYELKKLFPDTPTASLFKTPKPEKLLAKILHVSTSPGDIVLDFFLGSGTTAAVATKYQRRWIGVEWSAATIEQFTLPRLKRVLDGKDPGGVTEQAGWKGGSGFRIVEVSPSMFVAEEGIVFLADWMTNGTLAEATAAQLGFDFELDPPFVGTKGRTRLAVVDGVVNEDVVRLLAAALPDGQRLVVCGTGIDPQARPVLKELRPGSTLRKIPAALLDEYRTSRPFRLSSESLVEKELVDALPDRGPV
jgi:adenine-specific DNA-methyltransferase